MLNPKHSDHSMLLRKRHLQLSFSFGVHYLTLTRGAFAALNDPIVRGTFTTSFAGLGCESLIYGRAQGFSIVYSTETFLCSEKKISDALHGVALVVRGVPLSSMNHLFRRRKPWKMQCNCAVVLKTLVLNFF